VLDAASREHDIAYTRRRLGLASNTPHIPRVIPLPKIGGFLPFIPILTALGALGGLASGEQLKP